MDIKETSEVLAAARSVFQSLYDAAKDGSFGILDLRFVVDPARKMAEAVRGIDNVRDELRDLDSDEVEALVTELAKIVSLAGEAYAAVAEALSK